jgi:DNA methyltransferase 1-associated protein 1
VFIFKRSSNNKSKKEINLARDTMDAADILGIKKTETPAVSSIDDVSRLIAASKAPAAPRERISKPKGMSRELFALMGKDGITPAIQPAKNTGAAFKSKWTSSLKGKWVFKDFTNSARMDKTTFKHWVKADVEYQDYSYAKFNVSAELVTYSDDEYDELLHSSSWTRSETDHLMFLCGKYDLRWAVVADRYSLKPSRCCEDLQARYYSVVSRVLANRANALEANMRSEAHTGFDIETERKRRMQQEVYLRKAGNRDEKEENEVKALRDELKSLDSNIKKLRKAAKPTQADKRAAAAAAAAAAAPPPPVPLAGGFKLSDDIIQVPQPCATKPALQSSRLMVVESAPGMTTTLAKKTNWMLRELGVPDYPIPTRTVCDMLDNVRKDVVSLLSIQNAIHRKERELQFWQQQGLGAAGQQAVPQIPGTQTRGQTAATTTTNILQQPQVSLPSYEKGIPIPHSMIASRTEYRPATVSQPLTVPGQSGIAVNGIMRKLMPKRKGLDGSMTDEMFMQAHGHGMDIVAPQAHTATAPPPKQKRRKG